MIRKMEILSDPALEDKAANIRGTRIEILLKDGGVRSKTVPLPKGDPEVPLKDIDMMEKLRFSARDLYGEKAQQTLYETAMKLQEVDDVGNLIRILS
jgi:2-methylcitrate dehydratase PrpD